MGVKLCNSLKLEQEICNERIAAAKSVIHAARGLGSSRIAVMPNVMSKLYWAIAIPKMIYGLEATPVSKAAMIELENAHRQHAKFIQGLPANIPKPAALATIGWLSIESYIAVRKLNFLWKILCMQNDNVYRKVAVFILQSMCIGKICNFKFTSPIISMYKTVTKYGLQSVLIRTINDGEISKLASLKTMTKKIIWENEVTKWKASCIMYRELSIYRNTMNDIKLHPWWNLARRRPHLYNAISSVMAVLLGGQPRKLQQNFGSRACGLCLVGALESPQHILFECESLQVHRRRLWPGVLLHMPRAMQREVMLCEPIQKTTLLLSALNSTFIPEWVDIYENIAKYVYDMYIARNKQYEPG